ncbi:MAG: S-adenosylmethionine decarboxylase [Myxococcaceae bacterium]|nr:S-adenosylmethionine decarboxylase [Myxococcaceae bacterium]
MRAPVTGKLTIGQEWIIDASGCEASALKDVRVLAGLFEELVVTLALSVVGSPQWHVFPEPGGITGLALLSESHLAIHTFPEHGYAALSIYSCRTREALDFAALLKAHLKAQSVTVRTLAREAVQ